MEQKRAAAPHPAHCACAACVEAFDAQFARDFPDDPGARPVKRDTYAKRRAERSGEE